jgi:hypothetical protein
LEVKEWTMAIAERGTWLSCLRWSSVALVVFGLEAPRVLARPDEGAAGGVVLRELAKPGDSTRVWIELKARGLFQPGLPPGSGTKEVKLPKPLSLEVETRLVFDERVVEVDTTAARARVNSKVTASGVRQVSGDVPSSGNTPVGPGMARKAARHVVQAASAINGEVRPSSNALRPEVSLLVAERRGRSGAVVVVSPGGALSRSELEQVQGLGDPLLLGDLLPATAVAVGGQWRVTEAAAMALSTYDVVTANRIEATLESFDRAKARIRIKGEIEGSVLGGAGKMTCDGVMSFDRAAGRVERLEVNRSEIRAAGPVEAGLDVKSTLIVTRKGANPPEILSNAALRTVPLDVSPERELLRTVTPDGKATMLHDRQWHSFWDDPKLLVLKRIKNGLVTAQCNIVVGPPAGRGKHQDPIRFRDDIRRALEKRFAQFLGAGEIEGDPAGGFRYKVGIQGREGELGVVWYYFLVASPDGDQLLVTYTLAADQLPGFGNQDLEMVRSLRWNRQVAAGRGK